MPTARAAPHSLLLDSKPALRASLRKLRSNAAPEWGVLLAGHVLGGWAPAPGLVIGGYWPLEGEIDIRPLLLALAGRGHVVALPETPAKGAALQFHRWRPGMKLLPGRFGTHHPAPDPVTPDVLLVPMLGFDRRGHRIGYGAGYYDRTLALLPAARTIGCAFAVQEVPRVPAEPHDRALDLIATEQGVFLPG